MPKRPSTKEMDKRLRLLEKGLKPCPNCDKTKSVEDFAKDKRHYDGLQTYCRECCNLLRRTKWGKKIRANARKYHEDNKEKQNARKREYMQENREYFKEKHKEWMDDNVEHRRKYRKKYHEENKEIENSQARVRMKKWVKDNPDKFEENIRRRRIRKENADGFHTNKEWKKLLKLCDKKCLKCGTKKDIARDHIMPLSKGGSDYINNIQPLCKICNSEKYVDATDYRPAHIKQWAAQQKAEAEE